MIIRKKQIIIFQNITLNMHQFFKNVL